ncbi:MAG: hypothetical protein ACT4PO_12290 [Actinomycetota bacterium]
MNRSRSQPHDDGPTRFTPSGSDREVGPEARHAGPAVAGIACLTLFAGGVVVTGLISNGITREYGVDSSAFGVDDFVGLIIFNLPAFGLVALAVWFLRRSGSPVLAAWACLLTAVVTVPIAVVFTLLAVDEFGDAEGTGRVLLSRASVVFVLVIAILLARAGMRFLRTAHGTAGGS